MKKNDWKYLKEYCTGCGLCVSLFNISMELSDGGFYLPELERLRALDIDVLKELCPCCGRQCSEMDSSYLWGKREGVHVGFSAHPDIRYKASSGGVLTEICLYLLDNRMVDAILQTGKNPDDPIGAKLYCSVSREEVLECCGSRYTSSSPLAEIEKYLKMDMRFAFVGKPCDIAALKNLMSIRPEVKKKIPYTFSFFCAGAPSRNANRKLLEKMGTSLEDCADLTYRGNGWPGVTTSIDRDGNKRQILYREAWGETLGRDIRKICRFCIDGMGEMADISCGDAWYMDSDKRPSFKENDGRNIVFCRTESGAQIFLAAVREGYIKTQEYMECEEDLQYFQYHQYFKKGTMWGSILALKILGQKSPQYDLKKLLAYSKGISTRVIIKKFVGTIKRIIEGKI